MKKFLTILIFTVMVFSMPGAAAAATYTETAVTGLGSGYYMAWGTFSDGMCAFSDGEKYGYVNSEGKVVIGCKFSLDGYGFASSEFSEGVARTVINDKICFIDKSGKTVLATKYNYSANANQYGWSDTMNWGIAAFHEGRACIVGDNGKLGFIDKTGNAVTDFLFTIGAKFENGKAYVSFEGGGSNLIDLNGNKLLPRDYGRIDEQEDGSWYCYDLTFHPEIEVGTFFGTAYDTNSYDVYDRNFNYINTIEVNKKHETPGRLDLLRTIHQYGLDQDRYAYATEVGNGLVMAELKEFDADGNYHVLIDTSTKKELTIATFLNIEEFNDDGICVISRCCPENNVNYTKIGAIDKKGNLLVPFNYLGSSWAKEFNNGLLLAQRASDRKLVVVKLAGAGTSASTTADTTLDPISIETSTPREAATSSATLYKDGKKMSLTAYNIGGYTYFKLRDIGGLFGFDPIWNEKDNSITLKLIGEE